MDRWWQLLVDQRSAGGRLVTTLAVLIGAWWIGWAAGAVVARRFDDPYDRYYARKAGRYAVAGIAAISLVIVWRPFAGRFGVVLGLMAAGLAFAMQEVIGAVAGWFNVVSGRIYRVGDRIQLGGVRGDVIDVTPLRTKIMEIGSATAEHGWIHGRQYTGRIVAVSNKATFTEPVYNYSAGFDFIWEELVIPVPYDADWRAARTILDDEAAQASATAGAQAAIDELVRRYPIARADVEPRVFTRATDNWIELSARFVVPLRSARRTKDEMTERLLTRLADENIPVASTTARVTVEAPGPGPVPGGGR